MCIITWPLEDSKSGFVFLEDLLKITSPLSEEIILLTGTDYIDSIKSDTKTEVHNIRNPFPGNSIFAKIFYEFYYQLILCLKILKVHNKTDIFWNYGGATLLFPNLLIRILKKPLYVNLLGLESFRIKTVYNSRFGRFLARVVANLENISWKCASVIVVESENMIEFADLNDYKDKTMVTGARFIDFDRFNISVCYEDRENIVGFIGRLSQEKGADNLIRAIEIIGKENVNRNSVNFFICGDGPIRDELIASVNAANIKNVTFVGWVEHEDIPQILNKFKLLILPSVTEGLPTVILESMACGTPVLASAVGGIPDVITHGKTGYLMNDNSPETIAEWINKSLSDENINYIIANSEKMVRNNYSYNATVERYSKILYEENIKIH